MATDIETWMRETEQELLSLDRRIRSKPVGTSGGGGGAPTGPAGGDLAGTYPNPTIGTGKVTSTHILDGTITDTDVAAANKDGAANIPSMRTLGTGALQATAGNDARLTNSRTPTNHASTHQPGGSDAMAVDAAAATGSLRTLGTGATQAAAGNHTHTLSHIVAGGTLAPPLVLTEQVTTPTSIPAGSTALYVKADGLFYTVDDTGVERLLIPKPAQMHSNPSFEFTETSTAGGFCYNPVPSRLIPSSWEFPWCNGAATWAMSDDTNTFDGLGRSAKVVIDPGGGNLNLGSNIFTVTPGASLTLSVWVKGTTGTNTNIGIFTSPAAGNPWFFGTDQVWQNITYTPTTTWTKVTATFIIPPNHTKCRINLGADGNAGAGRIVWWDESEASEVRPSVIEVDDNKHLNYSFNLTTARTDGNQNEATFAARQTPDNWDYSWNYPIDSALAYPTIASDTTQTWNGQGSSVKVSYLAANSTTQYLFSSPFTAPAGTLVTVGFRIRSSVSNMTAAVGILTQANSNPTVFGGGWTIQNTVHATSVGTWTKIVGSFVVPTGHTHAKVAIMITNNGVAAGDIWIDDTSSSTVYMGASAGGSAGAPIGTISAWSGATAPSGYLLCDGASLSRSTYPALFNVIGTTYGNVDANTFNIPDLRGRFLLGAGTAQSPTPNGATAHVLAEKGGEQTHTMTLGELVSHGHDIPGGYVTPTASMAGFTASSTQGGASYGFWYSPTQDAANTGSSTAFNEMPPYNTANWIIKADEASTPLATDTLEYIDLAFASNYTPPVAPSSAIAPINTKKTGQGLTVSGTGVVTVPKAGVYHVNFSAMQNSTVTGYVVWTLYQRRGGSVVQQRETVTYGGGWWDASAISGLFDVLVNDTFEIVASAQTASTVIEATRAQFTLHRLAGPGPATPGEDTGWINFPLTASWANYGSGQRNAQYKRVGGIGGEVRMRGFIKNAIVATTIGTLPSGYRPVANENFPAPTADGHQRIEVLPTGVVQAPDWGGTVTVNDWISLAGIRFDADGS